MHGVVRHRGTPTPGRTAYRSLEWIVGLTLGLVQFSSVARAQAAGPGRIWGGHAATTCEFPMTVGLGQCSATLIHPRVVLSAAHCHNDNNVREVRFGETYSQPAKIVPVEYCRSYPDFEGSFGRGIDWAYCVLAQSVDDVPIAPPAMACELEGLAEKWPDSAPVVTLVGFGRNEQNIGGIKRAVKGTVRSVDNGEVSVGGAGKSGCFGDSGGSAFVQLADGTWRLLGIISYARGACGTPEYVVLAHRAMRWIEEELAKRQIDVTPCTDAQGVWQPDEKCGDLPAVMAAPGATWANGCSDLTRVAATTSCDPDFEPSDDPSDPEALDPAWEPEDGQAHEQSFSTPEEPVENNQSCKLTSAAAPVPSTWGFLGLLLMLSKLCAPTRRRP